MQIHVASDSEIIAAAVAAGCILAVPQINPQYGDTYLLAVTPNLL